MSSQLPTPSEHPNSYPVAEIQERAVVPWSVPEADGPGKGTPQLQRVFAALKQHRWVILGITVLGTAGGAIASRFVEPEYQAQTTLWMEAGSKGQPGPIRSGSLLRSTAWIDLLRSYVVLDHVVREQQLYLETARDSRAAFRNLMIQPQFRPGDYRLEVSSDGGTYVLTMAGMEVERGAVGSPIGQSSGLNWTPSRRVLSPGRVLEFTLLNPRDVAVQLAARTRASIARGNNFLRLSLIGTDPDRITATLNALAERYVVVAGEIKRDQLDQLTSVLNEQRQYAEDNLRNAEIELEDFRVATVTLPTDDGVAVAPGLASTRGPVMSQFFEIKAQRDQMRTERNTISRILEEAKKSGLSLDALTMVSAVQSSRPLDNALQERTAKRAELRALLLRYTPDHPAVTKLTQNIEDLEQRTIPLLAGELQQQLLDREAALDAQIGSQSDELRQIPQRALEEARLRRRVATAEHLYNMLKGRYEEARLAAVSTIPDLRVLDAAVVPSEPVRDSRQMVIVLGFLGSLGLGVLGVIAVDRMNPRVRYPEEITHGMGLPILGVVPNVKQVTKNGTMDATAHAAEAFREIRLNLLYAHGAAGPLMFTITSPGSGDGKSFISSNLALAFGDQGYRTLVIDGDIRRGTLHRIFGVQRVPGLTDLLSGTATLDEVLLRTPHSNVYVIAAGTRLTNGPELLGSPEMARVLVELKSRFGAIVVDSPPLGAGADAFALGTLTRNLMLVFRTGATDRAMTTAKLQMLDRLPIRLLGGILNGTSPDSGVYRYYSYIPGYGVDTEETEEAGQLQAGEV